VILKAILLAQGADKKEIDAQMDAVRAELGDDFEMPAPEVEAKAKPDVDSEGPKVPFASIGTS